MENKMPGSIQIIKSASYDLANKTFTNVSCLTLFNNTQAIDT